MGWVVGTGEYKMMPYSKIGAIVLAAGQSRRMGQPKLVLPWGKHTVIEQVVGTLFSAEIQKIVVVTGGARDLVEAALSGSEVTFAHNPDYDQSEMLRSLQVGIRALPADCQALLVVLGDQPLIEAAVVRAVVDLFLSTNASIVIPSYQMRRGHPWLVKRSHWDELLSMSSDQTMHQFIQAHRDEIAYVIVDTASILQDMDTPEDYQKNNPGK